MGLRNMGLLNIFLNTLALFTYFALYAAHKENSNQPYAALAMVIAFLGIGVFLANNRAFPMLDLSNQYAVATTDTQRSMLEAAGQSMLTVGQSHTPGTFLGFSPLGSCRNHHLGCDATQQYLQQSQRLCGDTWV